MKTYVPRRRVRDFVGPTLLGVVGLFPLFSSRAHVGNQIAGAGCVVIFFQYAARLFRTRVEVHEGLVRYRPLFRWFEFDGATRLSKERIGRNQNLVLTRPHGHKMRISLKLFDPAVAMDLGHSVILELNPELLQA
jgi:hypothetical protein